MSVRRLAVLIVALLALVACESSGNPRPSPSPDASFSPAEVTVERDIVYTRADGVDLTLDVYSPGGEDNPAVLVIHGGDWNHGSKNSFVKEGERLASEGFVAFVANYRLAPPGGRWHAPAPAQDLRAAVRWIRENAADYGADPQRVGALGSSAGGNLAQILGTTGEAGRDQVDAVVSWSGPTLSNFDDPQVLAVLNNCPGPRCPLPDFGERGTGAILLNYIGCTPRECPQTWRDASPFLNVDPGDAPMFLAVGSLESLDVANVRAMVDKLHEAGIEAELRVVEGQLHARAYEDEVIDESIAFLREQLGT